MSSSSTPSLEEAINSMRDNILRTQSQCNTAAITAYDNMVSQLKIFAQQINDKSVEIVRLQEVCKTNSIDFAIPPVVVQPKPAEPAKVTKPKN
jgi:hypothetical protein